LYARLDTGAEETFLRPSTCAKLNIPVTDKLEDNNSVTIMYGNGSTYLSRITAQLNQSIKAIVVDDSSLIDDLMSVNPILDLGYDVLLSSKGGTIMKN